MKSGPDRWIEVQVPLVRTPQVDYNSLLNRSRYKHGRLRANIERDIAKRQEAFSRTTDDVLKEWE